MVIVYSIVPRPSSCFVNSLPEKIHALIEREEGLGTKLK